MFASDYIDKVHYVPGGEYLLRASPHMCAYVRVL